MSKQIPESGTKFSVGTRVLILPFEVVGTVDNFDGTFYSVTWYSDKRHSYITKLFAENELREQPMLPFESTPFQ